MPKMKTHSGVKKRFSLTATGKVKYARPNKGHFLTNKSKRILYCWKERPEYQDNALQVIRRGK